MTQNMLQYLLLGMLVIGLLYFFYLIKDQGENIDENYYGIRYTLLDSLLGKEISHENIKKILRAVAAAVSYIETNVKNAKNENKEDMALEIIKESIKKFDFQKPISDNNIRCLIRLCCAFISNETK